MSQAFAGTHFLHFRCSALTRQRGPPLSLPGVATNISSPGWSDVEVGVERALHLCSMNVDSPWAAAVCSNIVGAQGTTGTRTPCTRLATNTSNAFYLCACAFACSSARGVFGTLCPCQRSQNPCTANDQGPGLTPVAGAGHERHTQNGRCPAQVSGNREGEGVRHPSTLWDRGQSPHVDTTPLARHCRLTMHHLGAGCVAAPGHYIAFSNLTLPNSLS
jgi:hypothetical protein